MRICYYSKIISSLVLPSSSSLLCRSGNRFFGHVPFDQPGILRQHADCDDGVWLFLGSNPSQCDGMPPKSKRRRNSSQSSDSKNSYPLLGRPEHVDKVDHNGTWHVQVHGTKTWYLRPCKAASDWMDSPPVLKRGMVGVIQRKAGPLHLKICVQAGDLLVVCGRSKHKLFMNDEHV